MDYEKAYKAVLQTAKQWIKDGCTDKEKICLECVFPELRESEDERTHRELVEYLNKYVSDSDTRKKCWLSYLEKQKQKEHYIPWYDYQKSKEAGYTIVPNEEYKQLIKQKEQKPTEWSEGDKENIKLIAEHLDNLGNTAMADILRNLHPQPNPIVAVDAEQLLKILPQKQKWNEEDERNLKLVIDFIYEFYPDPVMKYKLKDWLKSLRPNKQD